MYRPIIAITMGDAAGVGPEIIMKSLATKEIYECCRPVVVGDSERLREAGAIAGVSLQVNSIQEFAQAGFKPGRSEEHTSELPSLMRISYAVSCLKKKKEPH